MKAPLLIVGCLNTESELVLREVVVPLRRAGFVVEPVVRESIPEHLDRLASYTRERPDAVLLAPESDRSRRYSYNLANAQRAVELIELVRSLPDRVCFAGDVRAKTIPIVLAAFGDDLMFYGDFIEQLSGPVPSLRGLHICRAESRLIPTIIQAIRERRHSLFEQLDYFGYAITRDDSGAFQVGHALLRPRRESDILAEGASLKASPFYILQSDALDDMPAYRELEVTLNAFRQIAAADGCQPETVLQRFFERHPHMLFRGAHGRLHSKPVLPRPGKRPWAPDFMLEPRPLSFVHQEWGITDIKLPDAAVLEQRSAFHRGFSRTVKKALDQLTDYRDLIQSPDPRVREGLLRRFGTLPRMPRLAVVIGRRPDTPEDIEDFRRRARDLPLRAEVITYDDVLSDEAQRILLQLALGAKP